MKERKIFFLFPAELNPILLLLYYPETYPWVTNGSGSIPPLRLINAEDVGLEGGVTGNLDSQDPLVRQFFF